MHFTIPMTDEKSLAWLDAQSNMSFSLCMLMQRAFDRRGAVDMQASSIDEPRRRRTAAELAADREDEILRERAMGYDDGYDDSVAYQPPVTPVTRPAQAPAPQPVQQQQPMPQMPAPQMPAPEGQQTAATGAKRNRMLAGALTDFVGTGGQQQTANIEDIKAMMGR